VPPPTSSRSFFASVQVTKYARSGREGLELSLAIYKRKCIFEFLCLANLDLRYLQHVFARVDEDLLAVMAHELLSMDEVNYFQWKALLCE
jgi:hypothetical protein